MQDAYLQILTVLRNAFRLGPLQPQQPITIGYVSVGQHYIGYLWQAQPGLGWKPIIVQIAEFPTNIKEYTRNGKLSWFLYHQTRQWQLQNHQAAIHVFAHSAPIVAILTMHHRELPIHEALATIPVNRMRHTPNLHLSTLAYPMFYGTNTQLQTALWPTTYAPDNYLRNRWNLGLLGISSAVPHSPEGYRYIGLFIDAFSGLTHLFPLKAPTSALTINDVHSDTATQIELLWHETLTIVLRTIAISGTAWANLLSTAHRDINMLPFANKGLSALSLHHRHRPTPNLYRATPPLPSRRQAIPDSVSSHGSLEDLSPHPPDEILNWWSASSEDEADQESPESPPEAAAPDSTTT